MNTIREIQNLNKRELEAGVSTEASWHADYRSVHSLVLHIVQGLTFSRDTAYIYIGGLPFDISEGDIITIFSQYGEPTYINLIRDKESGKSKGFAFLKYEDQRSTDLAVDNLGGATVLGRVLKVDHTRYKRKDGEEEEEREKAMHVSNGAGEGKDDSDEQSEAEKRPLLKEEVELQKLITDHDDDDPMKEFLVQEKREEVAAALEKMHQGGKGGERKKHHHRHRGDHHKHRSKRRSRTPDLERERGRRHSNHRRRSRSP